MEYREDSDEPTANVPLMTALGRLVVRASELDEQVAAIIVRLCDRKTKKQLNRKTLFWKLSALQSIAEQAKQVHALFIQLSEFCEICLAKLKNRNSPVLSTYMSDDDGWFVKWDTKSGVEKIKAEQIDAFADEFAGLTNKAVDYWLQIGDLREQQVLQRSYAPVSQRASLELDMPEVAIFYSIMRMIVKSDREGLSRVCLDDPTCAPAYVGQMRTLHDKREEALANRFDPSMDRDRILLPQPRNSSRRQDQHGSI